MGKKMTAEEKDQYIGQLEEQLAQLLEKKDSRQIELIMQAQQDFLMTKYIERDHLISEIQRLTREIERLSTTIIMDQRYIDYLVNSFWWKITFPLRKISRKLKQKSKDDFQLAKIEEHTKKIDTLVSIVIFTYNAGRELSLQLENLQNQKLIEHISIVIIDKGSTDDTLKIAKENNVVIIDARGLELADEQIYRKCLSQIDGNYVVIMNQNKIIHSNYWLYQSIFPLENDGAILTAFLDRNHQYDINILKNEMIYHGMKNRLCKVGEEEVLFLPKNRDMVLYMTPTILDKAEVIVKKNSSNLFLL